MSKDQGVEPVRTSQNFPLFEQLALELQDKLQNVQTEKGKELHTKATAFYQVFRGWVTTPPRPDDRVAKIRALMDFVREANEYLAAIRG